MPAVIADVNLRTYSRPEVVSHYATLDYLTPCEEWLIETHVKPGMHVLDLGVGGGRTTSRLAKVAGRYVGVDYAGEMVRICRQRFPRLNFVKASASHMAMFGDASFDCIFFAFNGIDFIYPREQLQRSLSECRRLLRPGGLFIFSSHNPRAVLQRPSWNPVRVRQFSKDLAGRMRLPVKFILPVAIGIRMALACATALGGSIKRGLGRIPSAAFWTGEGYLFDPAHGGLLTHYWTPSRAAAELAKHGFRHLGTKGDDYPRPSRRYITDWYYYVFAKCE